MEAAILSRNLVPTNQTTILPNPSIQKNASGQDKEREERERQGAKALRLRGTDADGRAPVTGLLPSFSVLLMREWKQPKAVEFCGQHSMPCHAIHHSIVNGAEDGTEGA